MQLLAVFFAHLRKAVGRYRAGYMQLTGAVAIQFRAVLHDHMVVDGIDRRPRIVPVVLVAPQGNDGARHPGLKPVRTVRYQLARSREAVTVLSDRARMDGERARMRHQADQVRCLLHEPEHDGPLVGGLDTQAWTPECLRR